MASLCRSAAFAAAKSGCFRSRAALPKPSRAAPPKPFFSRGAVPLISRPISAAVGSTVSLMPLHSAIASARLRSYISENSRWSWLSQGSTYVMCGYSSGSKGSMK